MKAKIKSHDDDDDDDDDDVTDFYNKEIPKGDANHTCLAAISWILLSRKITYIIYKCF